MPSSPEPSTRQDESSQPATGHKTEPTQETPETTTTESQSQEPLSSPNTPYRNGWKIRSRKNRDTAPSSSAHQHNRKTTLLQTRTVETSSETEYDGESESDGSSLLSSSTNPDRRQHRRRSVGRGDSSYGTPYDGGDATRSQSGTTPTPSRPRPRSTMLSSPTSNFRTGQDSFENETSQKSLVKPGRRQPGPVQPYEDPWDMPYETLLATDTSDIRRPKPDNVALTVKLDLNLSVEITVKAKIHGDLTLTLFT